MASWSEELGVKDPAEIKVTGYERNINELNHCYLGPKINEHIGKYTYFNF